MSDRARDPETDRLYQTTAPAMLEAWLTAVETARDGAVWHARQVFSRCEQEFHARQVFSRWEQEFITDVRARLTRRAGARHPLSGRQIVSLYQLYERVVSKERTA